MKRNSSKWQEGGKPAITGQSWGGVDGESQRHTRNVHLRSDCRRAWKSFQWEEKPGHSVGPSLEDKQLSAWTLAPQMCQGCWTHWCQVWNPAFWMQRGQSSYWRTPRGALARSVWRGSIYYCWAQTILQPYSFSDRSSFQAPSQSSFLRQHQHVQSSDSQLWCNSECRWRSQITLTLVGLVPETEEGQENPPWSPWPLMPPGHRYLWGQGTLDGWQCLLPSLSRFSFFQHSTV